MRHRHCDIALSFPGLKTLFRLVVLTCLVNPGSLAEVGAQDRSDNAAGTAAHQGRHRDVIAPLLVRACSSCHGADEPEAGLVVTALDGSMDDSGEVAVWKKIRRMVDTRAMPPKDADPLSGEEVAAISSWIDEGQSLRREKGVRPCRHEQHGQSKHTDLPLRHLENVPTPAVAPKRMPLREKGIVRSSGRDTAVNMPS